MAVDFDAVLQSFYRAPRVADALAAFDEFLLERPPNLTKLFAFAHMARVSPAFRSGLSSRASPIVAAVLRGFDDPAFPRVGDGPPGPEELDLLWTEFFVTGDLASVRRLIGVLDEPDLVRERLTAWLQHIGIGPEGGTEFMKYLPLLQRLAIPVVFSESRIEGPVDLDLTVAVTARNGQLKFDELPFTLSQAELVRIAAKGAAIWSLRALAPHHERIAALCRDEAKEPGGAARALLAR